MNKENFTWRDFEHKKNRWRLAHSSSSFIICHLHLVERQSEKRDKHFFFNYFFQGITEMLVG